MRLVTDSVWLSHEKLAFIVHSTASGPASLVPLSSWIGVELGLIKDALPKEINLDAFTIFMRSIPSRFYPIFVITLIAYSIYFKREFGPMLHAERRAMTTGKLTPDHDSLDEDKDNDDEDSNIPARWINAVLPISFMIISVIVGLFVSGYHTLINTPLPEGQALDLNATTIIGSASSYDALMWASLGSCICAIILYLAQRVLTLNEIMSTFVHGVKDISEAILVLTLAWSIAASFKALQVPIFVVGSLGTNLSPVLLAPLVFLISCVISFATGTSWGTMSIVFPLALPLAGSVGNK